jgi:hypothetical protein
MMMRVPTLIVCLLMLAAGRGAAFYAPDTSATAKGAVLGTSQATAWPTNPVNGDCMMLVETASSTAADFTALSGWTSTGTCGSSGSSMCGSTTNFEARVAFHRYQTGDTAPTISLTNSASVTFAYAIEPIFMGSPAFDCASNVDLAVVSGNASSLTQAVAAAGVPSASWEENFIVGALNAHSTSCTGTCAAVGTAASSGLTTQPDRDLVTNFSNGPTIAVFENNTGPGAPSSIGSNSITFAAPLTAAVGATISVVLKRPAIGMFVPPSASPNQKPKGNYNYVSAVGRPTQWPQVLMNQPWIHGYAFGSSFAAFAPACGTYSTNYFDNVLLNNMINGKGVTMQLTAGMIDPAPTGTDASTVPGWFVSSAADPLSGCGALSTPAHFLSYWNKNFADVIGTPTTVMLPDDPSYRTMLKGLQHIAHDRWASIPNLVGVKGQSMSEIGTGELSMNSGITDGAAGLSCNGTAAQCETISGLGDWQATHAYAANSQIIPLTNNTTPTVSFFQVTAGGGGNSGSTQPNWRTGCATKNSTCADGALTWTNEGGWAQTFHDVANLEAAENAAGHSYVTTSSGAGSYLNALLTGVQNIEADWAAEWPNQAIMIDNVPNPDINTGLCTGSCSNAVFSQSELSAHNNSYIRQFVDMEGGLGCNGTCASIFTAPYLQEANGCTPGSGNVGCDPLDPNVMYGAQTVGTVSNLASANCASGTAPFYSIGYGAVAAASNCAMPTFWEGLRTARGWGYNELYQADGTAACSADNGNTCTSPNALGGIYVALDRALLAAN